MMSRKRKVGSKKWKKCGHKTREWFINQYGNYGILRWERTGRK